MTAEGRNLVLVGMPGTGKTSVGRAVAALLGRVFVDTDDLVVAAAGQDIPSIFRSEGEAGFREREKAAVAEVAQRQGLVVATGGGVPLDPENLSRLRAGGLLVGLWAAPEVLAERAGEGGRPLLDGGAGPLERIRELLAAREPVYRQADGHVDTSMLPVEEVAATVARLASSERVPVPGYDVWVGDGLLGAVGPVLGALGPGRRVLVVADAAVATSHAATVLASLRRSGFHGALAVVPAGESSKSLERAAALYDAALDAGLDRQGWVVAVGGGVVGDLAGFVAATFLRGVRFVPVPTTLLAQVDASVGGKVAVNLPRGKNLVGAFHRPGLVAADVGSLATLPEGELRSGLAEVVKHGVLADADYYRLVDVRAREVLARDPTAMSLVVAGSARIKADIVRADEREESGTRMRLNLGHTLAHAVETVAGYGTWRHGEAVAVGLCAAGRLAVRRGLWDAVEERDMEGLISRLGLPTQLGGLPAERLLAAMSVDKKARAGRLRWVLPVALGRVEVFDDVSLAEVRTVLSEVGAG